MLSRSSEALGAESVSFEGSPLVEVTLEGTDFRVDAGKQGTAFSISTRPSGTWDWTFGGEARWDGSQFRSRAFDRHILVELSRALSRVLADLE